MAKGGGTKAAQHGPAYCSCSTRTHLLVGAGQARGCAAGRAALPHWGYRVPVVVKGVGSLALQAPSQPKVTQLQVACK